MAGFPLRTLVASSHQSCQLQQMKLPAGFPTGLSCALVVVAAFTLGFALKNANHGDWISFIGSMFGAMVTVVGAVYVIQVQAEGDSRRYRDALRAILEDAMRHVKGCEQPTELHGRSPSAIQGSHAEMAMKMINVAKSMTTQRAPDTADLARAYMLIAEMHIDLDALDEALRPGRMYGTVTDVSEYVSLTKAALTSAIARLKL